MDLEDITPKQPPGPAIGEDLSILSVEELEYRIAALRQEISRVEKELTTKKSRQQAANDVFKS